jgi:hypothetical protein
MKTLVTFILAACVFTNAQASAVVVDFEGITPDDAVQLLGTPFVANGMEFSYLVKEYNPAVFGPTFGGGRNTNGSAILGLCTSTSYADCSGSYISMRESNGVLFSLDSLDASNLALSGTAYDVDITGHLSDGSTIHRNVDLTTNVWETITFDDSWIDLESVVIKTTNYSWDMAIDNIAVTVVPLPAAVWLLGSALAALGLCRRTSANRAP